MAETILRLQNVGKYYYSDTSVTQALRKINLEFQMGEFVAITGESGSGKSTLLNMISGLDFFDEGEMYFKGEPTFQFDQNDWEEYRRNQIGFVFQDYSLINHYTAVDNVVAALMIQGWGVEEAKERAMEYLKQVGLLEQAEQRASQLSSGQKQRLSIARALAKDTDIIVADEPTGNLDSETGQQVVELLEKLSHDRLVIMVTHNYEQAEPYVSRKVRLHDGEVVTDIPVNRPQEGTAGITEEKQGQSGTADHTTEKTAQSGQDGRGALAFASFFAIRNIRMQKGRAALFFTFFLITAVTSFLFIGELLRYADDRITKYYDTEAFYQENDTRIAVRHPDEAPMTEEDREVLRKVEHVEEVDLYDYCNDINYYIVENEDYKIEYGDKEEDTVDEEDLYIKGAFNPFYGKNSSQKDVAAKDEEQQDGEEEEGVQNSNDMGVRLLDHSHYMKSSTCLDESDLAAGRLPESRREVVLYSEDKKLLDQEMDCFFVANNVWKKGELVIQKVKVVGLLKKETRQVYFHYQLCQMFTVGMDGYSFRMNYRYSMQFKRWMGNTTVVPLIADDLKENEVRVSRYYAVPYTGAYDDMPMELEKALPGDGLLTKRAYDHSGTLADGEPNDIVILDNFSKQGGDMLEMSEKLFYMLYQDESIQGSIYIDNYSKTDSVIQKLQELGYDAVSTYQVSTTEYISEKVYQRLEVIGISCVVLFALVVLQILIVRSILKITRKNYHVLEFMGMRRSRMHQITYLEMGIHCVFALIVAIVAVVAASVAGLSFLREVLPYYSVIGVLLYLIYNIVLMALTVFFFHRSLYKTKSP